MIGKKQFSKRTAALALALLTVMCAGCGKNRESAKPAEPVLETEPIAVTASPEPSPQPTEAQRQEGERYEGVITFQGMEETVRYEHIRNGTIGFEMDYDYEAFVRQSEADRERFLSIWDDPENPENYLEVTALSESADTAAAFIAERLSGEYDVRTEAVTLDRAGSCIYIDASVIKNTDRMADRLLSVYVIPAPDGCRVAAAHSEIVESEYFGMRFHYFMNSFSVIAGQ